MTVREQGTKNCHCISRSLTKPWEGAGAPPPVLRFRDPRLRQRTSRLLYADEYLNSQAVEDWLSRYVEAPLGRARPALGRGEAGALDDWPMYPAAMLMLWLQGARSRSVREPDQGRSLEGLAAVTEADIDALVVGFRADYDLSLVFSVAIGGRLAPLCAVNRDLPRHVQRSFATLRHRGCASPSDRDALRAGALPVDPSGRADVSGLPPSISNFSIGPSQASKVVLLPASLVTTQFRAADLARSN